MADLNKSKLKKEEIEVQLKSAVEDLIPDVLDRIDLSTAQMTGEEVILKNREEGIRPAVTVIGRRLRVMTTLAAACLCMVLLAGGFYTYRNNQVDSVIGIDVNPSVELSVNRKNRVLEAVPLNDDAAVIMEGMDLEGVDLNVAVNAVIGSMVTHGYLADLENAILVTVTNDSVSKASSLRSAVVGDIQETLEENQVRAVVYDQQVIEEDSVKQLAEEYDISYGKAYFLKELIDQNHSLTMEDMEDLAPLTMEEIAKEITAGTYAVGGDTEVRKETTAMAQAETSSAGTSALASETSAELSSETDMTTMEETVPPSDTAAVQTAPTVQTSAQASAPAPETVTAAQTSAEETQGTVTPNKIKVYNADYDNGVVTVTFATKVKWKNPTVSVKDQEGTAYSAMMGDTDSSSCEIYVSGLEGGTAYTFVIGGISPKNGKQTTVKGSFDTPIFGGGSANEDPEETEAPEETEKPAEESRPPESQTEAVEPSESIPEAETPAQTESAPSEGRTTAASETSKEAETTTEGVSDITGAPADTEPV